MKERIEDMVIVARGKSLNGDTVITYFYKDQPELKRITIKKKDDPIE